MALPEDQEGRLQCYRNALANWNVTDYITFGKDALRWLRVELPQYSARELARLLYTFVRDGGRIDEQVETRPEWDIHPFHYDLRVRIEGRLVYFETRLICDDPDDPDDPVIYVVNAHDA